MVKWIGIVIIVDEFTPVAPDIGREAELLEAPEKTQFWMNYLKNVMRGGE